MEQPTVFILSCGDELLFGQTVDTNAAWLAERSTELGWRVVGQRTVGDVTPDIVAAIREATSRADVAVMSGGLGPTRDDRTRHALAEAMGVELLEDPEAVKEIAAMFKRFNRVMNESNLTQALIPVGAERIVNTAGTAPGIQARIGGGVIYCMPGVPREMREMFTRTVEPVMRRAEGVPFEVMRRLRLCGRGESDIGTAIRHLMGERSNPEVGTAVAESIVTVRLYAKGDSMAAALRVADRAEEDIRKLLGEDVFGVGDETLADVAVRLLKERGAGLVTAESCTGGMLSSLLVNVPGVSDVFYEGLVTYSNQSKMRRLGVGEDIVEKYGAVSRETAAAMAEKPLRMGEYPYRPMYSLATTGIAGPDGGTPDKPVGTVWIACSRLDQKGDGLTRTMLYNTVSDRYGIRVRASNAALDLLRRTILGYPSNQKVAERAWRKA